MSDNQTTATAACTCVGACKGATGLGEGWHCVMERMAPASVQVELKTLRAQLAEAERQLAVARAELVLNAACFRNYEPAEKWAEQTEAVIAGTSVNERWHKLEDAEYESHNRACDAEGKLEAMTNAVKSLRRYQAVEGHDGSGKHCGKVIGMAYDGSIWGFTHDPNYEPWELLETAEKWLHEKLDAILNPQPEQPTP